MHQFLRPLVLSLLVAGPATGAPALWKVTDEDSSVWLFGSIHMLPEGANWRTDLFDSVLAEADRVYFETNIGPEGQAAIMPLTLELGFVGDGPLLSQRIGPELTDRLRETANTYDIPMPALLTMQPWMAATTISVAALVEAGYDPLLGVDNLLQAEVPVERQGFFETPEEQLHVLASADEAEQIEMLEATLAEIDRMVPLLDEMVAAWQAGTPEELGSLFMTEMGAYGDEFVATLIDERNHNWVAQIETMLSENEQSLVVVGAAHLVEDVSVARLLEDKGFSVERLQ